MKTTKDSDTDDNFGDIQFEPKNIPDVFMPSELAEVNSGEWWEYDGEYHDWQYFGSDEDVEVKNIPDVFMSSKLAEIGNSGDI